MANTKIIQEDLDLSTRNLLKQISDSKGETTTLPERLSLMETSIKDLKTASGLSNELSNKINMLGEYGNFSEVFGYDTYGNVIKQTVTGDMNFTIDYIYADAVNGTLNYSEKKFVNQDNKSVIIKKIYTYNATTGNITGIATTTTVATA